jgi:hypothetical protein
MAGCAMMLDLFDELGLDTETWSPYTTCLNGGYVSACNGPELTDCHNVWVTCNFMSNELVNDQGVVPLDSLEKRELCGSAAAQGDTGDTGEPVDTGDPVGAVFHVALSPTQTSAHAHWTSRTWGSGHSFGTGGGYVEYRVGACPTDVGDCINLRRLVVYGGDAEINGIEVSNLIAQLTDPVWLPYDSDLSVDLHPRALSMLLTYKLGDDRIGWKLSNTNSTGGVIDPSRDVFRLDTLVFSASEEDTVVTLELDVGGSHQ